MNLRTMVCTGAHSSGKRTRRPSARRTTPCWCWRHSSCCSSPLTAPTDCHSSRCRANHLHMPTVTHRELVNTRCMHEGGRREEGGGGGGGGAGERRWEPEVDKKMWSAFDGSIMMVDDEDGAREELRLCWADTRAA